MTVRRLHSEQPASFAFTRENAEWAKAQIAKFPAGKEAAAVIPILWRVQEQEGWVSEPAIRAVADMLSMPYIRVYEVATFYTMFQLSPVGSKAHVQVCGTTPCMLRGSLDLIEVCKERINVNPHSLDIHAAFSWEEVECLGSCANAPMVQIGSDTFEDLTPDLLHKLLDAIERGRPVKPGSQTGRVASCPATGPTTLKEYAKEVRVGQAVREDTVQLAFGQAPPDRPRWDADAEAGAESGEGYVGQGIVSHHLVVGDETLGDMRRPLVYTKPKNDKADDLKLVYGIGPGLEKMLNKLGIWHFDQIAGWSVQNIKWIDQQLEDFRGRAERDRWVEQARKLASGWRPGKDTGEKV